MSEQSRIIRASIELFAEKGYHGSSMRQLSKRAGKSLSGCYHYFPRKQDVLIETMTEAQRRLEEAAVAVMDRGLAPHERLAALVEGHVRVHLADPMLARVADRELRSLEPAARVRVVATRDRYEAFFRTTLEDGVRRGVFPRDIDIAVTSMAIITMATAVIDWWRPLGALLVDDVACEYSRLAVRLVMRGTTPDLRSSRRS